jgi:DNA-binding response OmpR family regulator
VSGRVLLVEDDRSLAELVGDYLSLAGFACETCADGTAGLELALRGEWDLLVLDLMLPGLDGFEICRRVREASDKPILILSARREDIDKIRGLGLGADDYVTKPFSPSELTARVKAHLARYRRLSAGRTEDGADERSRGLAIRGLYLDPDAKSVKVHDREVELTAKEFELLHLLMRNPDRVFSREDIFSRIWGEDRFGDSSTVTVHVRKIREKIEADPSDPRYLETVWGMGYRIRVS